MTITAAILLLLLAGLVIPTDFDMRAKGALVPKTKREVFAPMPGEVIDVMADNGSKVNEGDILVQMRNPTLEIQKKDIEGKYNAAQEQLSSATAATALQPNSGLTPQERVRLQGEVAKLRHDGGVAGRQLDVIKEQVEKLTVRSPITGQVITWDVKKNAAKPARSKPARC